MASTRAGVGEGEGGFDGDVGLFGSLGAGDGGQRDLVVREGGLENDGAVWGDDGLLGKTESDLGFPTTEGDASDAAAVDESPTAAVVGGEGSAAEGIEGHMSVSLYVEEGGSVADVHPRS